jgi:hypothetical protein
MTRQGMQEDEEYIDWRFTCTLYERSPGVQDISLLFPLRRITGIWSAALKHHSLILAAGPIRGAAKRPQQSAGLHGRLSLHWSWFLRKSK